MKPAHIVVVGATPSGLLLTLRLGRLLKEKFPRARRPKISLVNSESAQSLKFELPKVLRVGSDDTLSITDFLKGSQTELVQARLTSLDPSKRILNVQGQFTGALEYTHLIVASRLKPQIPAIEGLMESLTSATPAENVFVIRDPADVLALRKRLLSSHPPKGITCYGNSRLALELTCEMAALGEKFEINFYSEPSSWLPGLNLLAQEFLKNRLRKKGIRLKNPAEFSGMHKEAQNLLVIFPSFRLHDYFASAFGNSMNVNQLLQVEGFSEHYGLDEFEQEIFSLEACLNQAEFLAAELANTIEFGQDPGRQGPSGSSMLSVINLGPHAAMAQLGPPAKGLVGRLLRPWLYGPWIKPLTKFNRFRYVSRLYREVIQSRFAP